MTVRPCPLPLRGAGALVRLLAAMALAFVVLLGCKRKPADEEALPRLGHVPSFTLTDQDGQPFSLTNLRGEPHLVSFMFTRCPTICPRVLEKKKALLALAQQKGLPLDMVSISIDGENDTAEVLRAYATKHQLDLERWSLLTGDATQVAQHAEQSFKIAVSGQPDEAQPHFGLTHGSHLVLVDGEGEIRGYYASMDADTPARLMADLDRL